MENGLIDDIVDEPLGGAHRDPQLASEQLQRYLVDTLRELGRFNPRSLVERRYEKFRKIGVYSETAIPG